MRPDCDCRVNFAGISGLRLVFCNVRPLILFPACEPLAGWRQVAVTQRRTMQDFAHQMRWLVDEAYPEVEVVQVVLDNLNTHRVASLYETFPAPQARRIAYGWSFTTPLSMGVG